MVAAAEASAMPSGTICPHTHGTSPPQMHGSRAAAIFHESRHVSPVIPGAWASGGNARTTRAPINTACAHVRAQIAPHAHRTPNTRSTFRTQTTWRGRKADQHHSSRRERDTQKRDPCARLFFVSGLSSISPIYTCISDLARRGATYYTQKNPLSSLLLSTVSVSAKRLS